MNQKSSLTKTPQFVPRALMSHIVRIYPSLFTRNPVPDELAFEGTATPEKMNYLLLLQLIQ